MIDPCTALLVYDELSNEANDDTNKVWYRSRDTPT